jgi:hypothetical protein
VASAPWLWRPPLHQNDLHVRALVERLGLPRNAFLPVVFFIGDAQFKTPLPPNVLNKGLVPRIRQHQDVRLDPPALENALVILEKIHRSTDHKAAARAHLTAIRSRTSPEKATPRRRRSQTPSTAKSKS